MSFTFKWPRFSDQFHYDAIQMLNTALNKGSKPPVIADKIEVVELEMGTQPPELEIRDIGDLTIDQFRGIFRLTYSGDAHIVLKTKVQANPLNHKQPDIHLMTGSRGMLAAKQPLEVPMLLRLSHFKLNSYVVLVVSKQKGITLVFKTDPLQNVDINSTFDSIAVIQKFIQREIEGQLRQMFREDLPSIIHRLSQQWVKATVEAPYLTKLPPPSRMTSANLSSSDLSFHTAGLSSVGLDSQFPNHQASGPGGRRPSSVAGTSRTSAKSAPSPASLATPEIPVSFPDLENFDPTYGLRPEGLPTKSIFSGFSSLFTPNKGLADLAEETSEFDEYEDEAGSFDVVDWETTIPDTGAPPTVYDDADVMTQYETIPAVGGGTVTRPRIYHSQSLAQLPSDVTPSSSSSSSRPALSPLQQPSRSYDHLAHHSAGVAPRRTNSLFNTSFAAFIPNSTRSAGEVDPRRNPHLSHSQSAASHPLTGPLYGSFRRPNSPDSVETQPSRSSSGIEQSILTPPSSDHPQHEEEAHIYMKRLASERQPSLSLSDGFHSAPNYNQVPDDPEIVLRPSLNNSIHQLSTLSYSNHTLSPYTRSLSHFTVRSVPPRGMGSSGPSAALEKLPVKARRKRTYRFGGRSKDISQNADPKILPTTSPLPPSEFDASDMDRYFRSHDDLTSHSLDIHPTHVRRV